MSNRWWKQLHQAINANETLEALSKAPVDPDDQDMREGLAILQVLVMKKAPTAVDSGWSPLLRKVASCKPVSQAIAKFLLDSIKEKDLKEEV